MVLKQLAAERFTYRGGSLFATITDTPSRAGRFTDDPAGRLLTQMLSDLREIHTTYDANGNVASITPPSHPPRTRILWCL